MVRDTASPCFRRNVHPPQFGRVLACRFQPEDTEQNAAFILNDPEAAAGGAAVIIRDTLDLVAQRNRDIGIELQHDGVPLGTHTEQ